MPYTIAPIENLPAPAILVTLTDPYDANTEPPRMINEADAAVAQIAGDLVYVVVNPTGVKMNLGLIMSAMAAAFVPHHDISTQHLDAERVRTIMIGSNSLIKMATNATGQDQYGNRKIELFPTVDAALEHIRLAV